MSFSGKHSKAAKFFAISIMILLLLGAVMAGCSTAPAPASTPSLVPAATPPKPANPQLLLASTTSTHDSGLMDVLLPIFEQQTGYQVKPIMGRLGAGHGIGTTGEC